MFKFAGVNPATLPADTFKSLPLLTTRLILPLTLLAISVSLNVKLAFAPLIALLMSVTMSSTLALPSPSPSVLKVTGIVVPSLTFKLIETLPE